MVTISLTTAWAVVFLLLSAFFSASETALFSIPRERIPFFEHSAKKRHRWVFLLLRDGQRTLLLILLGNLFVNITVVGLIHDVVSHYIAHNSPLATLAIATAVILVFGEIVPKNAALGFNEPLAVAAAPVLYYLRAVSSPILTVMQRVNAFFLAHARFHLRRPSPYITLDELKGGIGELERDRAVSKREQAIITRVLDAGAVPISRIMQHRSRVVSLDADMRVGAARAALGTAQQLFGVVRRSGNVNALVYIGDMLSANPDTKVGEHAIPVEWAPDTLDTAELIGMMIQQDSRHVCVVDEFGDFAGVFSLEDALRKVVASHGGDDGSVGEDGAVQRIFDGMQELEAIPEWIPPSLEKQARQYRTLNGLITGRLGKIPKSGETVAIDDWHFYIINAQDNRIESVLIRKKD